MMIDSSRICFYATNSLFLYIHTYVYANFTYLQTILLYTPLDGAYTAWRREFPDPLLTRRQLKIHKMNIVWILGQHLPFHRKPAPRAVDLD